MLQKAKRDSIIEGIKICRGAPRVNHLFFVDDSLILMRAKVSDAQELGHILEVYEETSRHVIIEINHQQCSTQTQVIKLEKSDGFQPLLDLKQ